MKELCEHDAIELRRLIGARQASPEDVLESCIARIEAADGGINAIPIRCFDRAREEARAATRAVTRGDRLGALHGLPIAVKDLCHVGGLRTTFGSPIYADFVAERDDRVVALVRAAGAIVLGKTNTTEFGAGNNTTNDVFGPTRNPFDPARTSGGSSGGAAAALAVDMVPLATGTDTGGSLRVPAAFCGTCSLRPSLGVVPFERRPQAFSPFSVQGPMARGVADLALLFGVMAREDPADPLSQRLRDGPPAAPVDLSTLRVGVSADLGFAPTGGIVRRAFERKVAAFAPLFAACTGTVPDLRAAVRVNWVLRGIHFRVMHEAHYEQHRDRLGPLVVRNYEEALELDAEDVVWATREQMALHQGMAAYFADHDLLICPVATVPPFAVEDLYPPDVDGVEQATYVEWAGLTNGLSVTGNPVVTLPCGRDETGMPFGLQLVGPRNADHRLLAIAAAIEAAFAGDDELARPRKREKGVGDG